MGIPASIPAPPSTPQGRIRALLVGKAVPFARAGATSAIDKSIVDRALSITLLGLDSDEQADLRVHGGPDKAIHAYAWDHYRYWRQQLPECQLWERPGAFGENFSVDGLDESSVCIGDHWSAGSALLEVSQGRQPCWKLNPRFGVVDMSLRVQESLRAGWYFRVIQCGTVRPHDPLELVARPHPEWSIERLLALIRNRTCDRQLLGEVLRLPLTSSWRKLFSRRAEFEVVEDWGPRLNGKSAT